MRIDSYANVAMLAIANAFAFSSIPLLVFAASLIGANLTPVAGLATAPVAACVIGLATGIWPVSKVTAYLGRKTSFFLFLWAGVGTCLLAAWAIEQRSFYLFLLSAYLFGFSGSSIQQFRYAAIECMGADKAPTAASIILSGGIFAAFVGPELAVLGKNITTHDFQGSFWLSAICMAIASLFVLIFQTAPIKTEDQSLSPRPLQEMINPAFLLAICSGAVSYFVMNLIMTATPISMHHYFMHSLNDTKFVIQSHIAAMYLPSLISPFLFRVFGTLNMMKMGLFLYALTIVLGQFMTDVLGFWLQLVLLGVGWNFLFVAGTAMLTNSYQHRDRLKAQVINDGLMFSLQAVAAISAGVVMVHVSWAVLLSIGLAPMVVMLVVLYWYNQNKIANDA